MVNEKEIHLMFYENGKTKDRKDPSKRVTKKVYWPETFTKEIVQEVFSTYRNKIVEKLDTFPFFANMAYNGLNFVKSLSCYAKISNKVIAKEDITLISKSKNEIFSFIGYLITLKRKVEILKENKTRYISLFLCEPIFRFENYKKLLKLIGIKVDDSKTVTRSRNVKRIIRNSLGYDSSKITLERLERELDYQIEFFTSLANSMCFDTDDENFVLYILRYDLKKCKT